jgi:hypothetical protein
MYSLELSIITSLKVIFIYTAMKPGMILDFLPRFYDWLLHFLPAKAELYLRKPLYDCLFCCSSVYGILFTYQYFSFTVPYLFLILQAAGINYLVATVINWFHDQEEKNEKYHAEALYKEKEAAKKE